MSPTAGIPLLISSCLLGNKVRYDGDHRLNEYICADLARVFELQAVCPEMAIGLGVPRKPIQLVQVGAEQRVRGIEDSSLDVTTRLYEYADELLLQSPRACGMILKKSSPSCGVGSTRLYDQQGKPIGVSSGGFARRIMQTDPAMPIIDDAELGQAPLRENFLNRVRIMARWKAMLADGLSKQALMDFHACHKYELMAHDEPLLRTLGQSVTRVEERQLQDFAQNYIRSFMQGMRKLPGKGQHSNALQHVLGYFKHCASPAEVKVLHQLYDAYGQDQVSRDALLEVLASFAARLSIDYLQSQTYLQPVHPWLAKKVSQYGG